ncbi:hypothetical protein BYT27DRAFT_7245050 [Phlegmacium glaucopus]|nr:hypothetical protein BYT27DRAFT_7245050 [Phlegmacium glaucopus]
MEECFTTIWQPKLFPVAGFTLPSIEDLATPSYIRQVFDGLIDKATVAGRHVIRVLDLDTSSVVANAVGESLVAIPSNKLLVDYFLAGMTPEDADEKARAMSYPRARPFVLDPTHTNDGISLEDAEAKARAMNRARPDSTQTNSGVSPEDEEAIARAIARARQAELDPNFGEYAMIFSSFDILFQVIDASISASDVETLLQYLAPCGVLVLLYQSTSADSEKPEDEQALTLPAFQQIPELDISVANLATGEALILFSPDSVPEVVIYHFSRGSEAELVEIVNQSVANSEIWILGDDDAIGIGALGIAACIIAESPNFIVRSLYIDILLKYLPWDKVVQNRFEPVQNWFSDFWPMQNQNQNQMAGGEPEPEPNQNRGSVQLVLVLWTGSEPNFGIPRMMESMWNPCGIGWIPGGFQVDSMWNKGGE